MFLREAAEEIGPTPFIDYPLLRNVCVESNEHNEMRERNFSGFRRRLCIEHRGKSVTGVRLVTSLPILILFKSTIFYKYIFLVISNLL